MRQDRTTTGPTTLGVFATRTDDDGTRVELRDYRNEPTMAGRHGVTFRVDYIHADGSESTYYAGLGYATDDDGLPMLVVATTTGGGFRVDRDIVANINAHAGRMSAQWVARYYGAS